MKNKKAVVQPKVYKTGDLIAFRFKASNLGGLDTAGEGSINEVFSNGMSVNVTTPFTDPRYLVMKDEVICRLKVVKNLLSGIPVTIDEDTPMCCDPSTETYHSM